MNMQVVIPKVKLRGVSVWRLIGDAMMSKAELV